MKKGRLMLKDMATGEQGLIDIGTSNGENSGNSDCFVTTSSQ